MKKFYLGLIVLLGLLVALPGWAATHQASFDSTSTQKLAEGDEGGGDTGGEEGGKKGKKDKKNGKKKKKEDDGEGDGAGDDAGAMDGDGATDTGE